MYALVLRKWDNFHMNTELLIFLIIAPILVFFSFAAWLLHKLQGHRKKSQKGTSVLAYDGGVFDFITIKRKQEQKKNNFGFSNYVGNQFIYDGIPVVVRSFVKSGFSKYEVVVYDEISNDLYYLPIKELKRMEAQKANGTAKTMPISSENLRFEIEQVLKKYPKYQIDVDIKYRRANFVNLVSGRKYHVILKHYPNAKVDRYFAAFELHKLINRSKIK